MTGLRVTTSTIIRVEEKEAKIQRSRMRIGVHITHYIIKVVIQTMGNSVKVYNHQRDFESQQIGLSACVCGEGRDFSDKWHHHGQRKTSVFHSM